MREVKTDLTGGFNLGDLGDGSYNIFVDIPGLPMTGTCDFTISGGTVVNGLDYLAGADSIFPGCQSMSVSIKEKMKTSDLISAFPNPFAENTVIKINIQENSAVLLEVFNILGEKVQTLDKSQKQPGEYTYSFSAKVLNHAKGVYFVKLSVGNKTSVLKLIEQ